MRWQVIRDNHVLESRYVGFSLSRTDSSVFPSPKLICYLVRVRSKRAVDVADRSAAEPASRPMEAIPTGITYNITYNDRTDDN